MTGQQLAQRLSKAGWNAIVDYGVGTAGKQPEPDLIREFYDGMCVHHPGSRGRPPISAPMPAMNACLGLPN